MPVNTLGEALFSLRPLAATSTTAGPAVPFGFRTKVAASPVARLLCVLLVATGAVVGGEAFTRGTLYKNAAPGTYYDYEVDGNTGDQEWVYVVNETGATIDRGTPVKYDPAGSTAYSVTPMVAGDHPDELVGIAQWDIGDDICAFVVCGNFAECTIDGAGTTDGQAVTIATGGVVDVAAVGDPTIGRALTTTGAGLADILVRSR